LTATGIREGVKSDGLDILCENASKDRMVELELDVQWLRGCGELFAALLTKPQLSSAHHNAYTVSS
jgi:hypothetical protein